MRLASRRLFPLLLLCLLVPLVTLVGGTSTATAAPVPAAASAAATSVTTPSTVAATGARKLTKAEKKAQQKAKKQARKKARAAKRAQARARAKARAAAKAAAAAQAAQGAQPATGPRLPVPPLVGGVEDYAVYEPQRTCSPDAKPGAPAGLRWAVATFGGRAGGISRACGGAASEHKEGRAFDWMLNADDPADQARAQAYLAALFATGPSGQHAELARRMGVMYVIWDDQMYAAYRHFAPTPYVSSSCKGAPLAQCSKTLRHRDHVHVSLSWAGGLAQTSWYATPDAQRFR